MDACWSIMALGEPRGVFLSQREEDTRSLELAVLGVDFGKAGDSTCPTSSPFLAGKSAGRTKQLFTHVECPLSSVSIFGLSWDLLMIWESIFYL